jgi:hypothetical protein
VEDDDATVWRGHLGGAEIWRYSPFPR